MYRPMKYKNLTRLGLSSKIDVLYKKIEENNAFIEHNQRRNDEIQEEIAVVKKALELIGGAWSPPKTATKKFVKRVAKKKAVKKVKLAKKVERGKKPLDFVLKLESRSGLRIRDIIHAFEGACTEEVPSLSFQELFQAVNARRVSKIKGPRLSAKLYDIRHSPAPELSSIFQKSGHGKEIRYLLNRTAVDNFKKASKAFA